MTTEGWVAPLTTTITVPADYLSEADCRKLAYCLDKLSQHETLRWPTASGFLRQIAQALTERAGDIREADVIELCEIVGVPYLGECPEGPLC